MKNSFYLFRSDIIPITLAYLYVSYVLLHMCISIHPSIHPSIYPSILPSIHPSIYPSVHTYIHIVMRRSARVADENIRDVSGHIIGATEKIQEYFLIRYH